MSTPLILVNPSLAQAPPATPGAEKVPLDKTLMGISGALVLLLVAALVYYHHKVGEVEKKLRLEEFRNRDLHKKYKLAVATIAKMEKNPDLVHSRDFNLDYLRMRMAEETFNYAIVNQMRVKVKNQISEALRPTQESHGQARKIDQIFDIQYETGEPPNVKKATLFRIQVKLTKLPTQPTSATVNQIIDCMEAFLSPGEENDTWQPTIQGRIAYMQWDQKAKPTPLLVLEQTNEGVNVTFRTHRSHKSASDATAPIPSGTNGAPSKPQAGSVGKATAGKATAGKATAGKAAATKTSVPKAGKTSVPSENTGMRAKKPR